MEMSNIKTIQKSLREIYLFSLLFKKLKNVGNTGSGETLEEIFYLLKEKELQVRPLWSFTIFKIDLEMLQLLIVL